MISRKNTISALHIYIIGVLFTLGTAASQHLYAQGPNSSGTYYQSADQTKGSSLKTALYGIINSHTTLSYSSLWNCYKTSDLRSDGKIWDMYSNITNFDPDDDRAGNYSGEGDVFNREHSFPKSWFDDKSPMYSDLMHIVPTDGYVNNRRSNFPFGETDGETYKSANGFSKLGASTVQGYTGTVFEPNDEYKGDFARIYFYMVTCYEDKVSNWSSAMLSGDKYPAFSNWALTMLLDWAKNDPVSQKEIDRNNAVYKLQGNRNPYVDYPGLEQYVWGDLTASTFSYDNYTEPTNSGGDSGGGDSGGGDSGSGDSGSGGTTGGGDGSGTVADGTYTFTKVTSASQLVSGKTYIIVCESASKALGATSSSGKYHESVSVDIDNSTITTAISTTGVHAIIATSNGSYYTLYDATEKNYLSLTKSDNALFSSESATANNALWNISVSESTTNITNAAYSKRYIQYNSSSPRFACYTSGQKAVTLYVSDSATGIGSLAIDDATEAVVYSIDGRKIKSGVVGDNLLEGLPRGIYIVNGKKYVRR